MSLPGFPTNFTASFMNNNNTTSSFSIPTVTSTPQFVIQPTASSSSTIIPAAPAIPREFSAPLQIPKMITSEELKSNVVKPMPEVASNVMTKELNFSESGTKVRRLKPITTTLEQKDMRNYYPQTLQMFPVACYTCGFRYRVRDPTKRGPLTLEEAAEMDIRAGIPLKEIMDKNKIIRMCCRTRFIEAPFIIQLQKEATLNKQSEIGKAISELNLNNTNSQNIILNFANSNNNTFSTIGSSSGTRILDLPPMNEEPVTLFDIEDENEEEIN